MSEQEVEETKVEELSQALEEPQASGRDLIEKSKEELSVSETPPEDRNPIEGALDTKEYWCGTTDDSPVSIIYLGGYDFPRATQDVWTPPGTMRTKRRENKGVVHHLTAAEVESIKIAASQKVVRRHGVTRASIYDKRNKYYRPYRDDESVSKYVYMISIDNAVEEGGAYWQNQDPKTRLIDTL